MQSLLLLKVILLASLTGVLGYAAAADEIEKKKILPLPGMFP